MIKSYPTLKVDKNKLWEIYNRCEYKIPITIPNLARVTNVFITDKSDIEYLFTMLDDWGIKPNKLNNNYSYSSEIGVIDPSLETSFNFNVIPPGGWVFPHRDVNPTKINILLNEKTEAPYRDVNSSNEYFYDDGPVLLKVGELHTVDNCDSIKEDRVTFQAFLIDDFETCERTLDENRSN